jgi:UDP-glucuronate 4-epimerase
MRRDFTYVDDVTEGVVRLLHHAPSADPAWSGAAPRADTSNAPWRIYNVGNSSPVDLSELVAVLEDVIGRPAIRELLPMQPGDVVETCADSADLERAVGFRPNTSIKDGARRFVEWFRAYHRSAA